MHNYSEKNIIVVGGLIWDSFPFQSVLNHYKSASFININYLTFDDVKERLWSLINASSMPPIIIGYSCGGTFVISQWNIIKNHVEKIILLNSAPYFMQNEAWNGIMFSDYLRLCQRLERQDLSTFVSFFYNLCNYPNREKLNPYDYSSLDKKIIRYWLEFLRMQDNREIFTKLDKPCLLVYSDNDILAKINEKPVNENVTQQILNNSTHLKLNSVELLVYLENFIYG